jgi:TolB-like protein
MRALLLVLAVLWAWWPLTALAGPTVAVLDLANATGDAGLDGAGPGVAAVLVSKLARVEAVTVVERQRLQAVREELALQASGLVDPATAARAGKLVGADYIVTGTLFSVKLPALSVNLRVVDVESGAVVVAEEVRGEIGARGEEFFVLVDELAFRVIDAMEVRLGARDRVELGQIGVRELSTVEVYGRALSALDAGDVAAARGLLDAAVKLEPGFALAEDTLVKLSAQAVARRTSFASESVEAAYAHWDAMEAVGAVGLAVEDDTPESLARRAVAARVALLRGDVDRYLSLEEDRLSRTERLLRGWTEDARRPGNAFDTFVRDTLRDSGLPSSRDGTFGQLVFLPFELRDQLGAVLTALGRPEEGLALAVAAWNQPGPREHPRDRGRDPRLLAERWGVVDAVVRFAQEDVRVAELLADEAMLRNANAKLLSALAEAKRHRDEDAAYRGVVARLRREPASDALGRAEASAVRRLGDHPALVLTGYEAFVERVGAGYYAPIRSTSTFRDVAGAWQEAADHVFSDRWWIERRVRHLLLYQEQVPPRDEAERDVYARRVTDRLDSEYRR